MITSIFNCPLSVFIDAVIDGDYSKLNDGQNTFQTINEKYGEMVGGIDMKVIISLLKMYADHVCELQTNTAIGQLGNTIGGKQLGYKLRNLYGIYNENAIQGNIAKLKLKIESLEKQLAEVKQNKNKESGPPTREMFDESIIILSEHFGFKIDRERTMTSEYATMVRMANERVMKQVNQAKGGYYGK